MLVVNKTTATMSETTDQRKVEANAHPDSKPRQGGHSTIPHPPPEDRHRSEYKPVPDTGWRGQPKIPSQSGGDGEPDFLNKPPYKWLSEGDLFDAKYYAYVASCALLFKKQMTTPRGQ